jgi:hypothetical protein
LRGALAAALGPAVTSEGAAADTPRGRVVLGAGRHRYEWVPGWAKLPPGMQLGNTHGGIVVDGAGRVYANTDSDHAVLVFEPSGTLVASWGSAWKGGAHGMALAREGRDEVLVLGHIGRHEVVKLSLGGEVLQTYPCPMQAGIYKDPTEYKPTGVAVAANGDVYAADGYGRWWVHRFARNGDYLGSFGGPGEGPGRLREPHGLWIDTRRGAPRVVVADRDNHRLQWFTMDGKFLRELKGVALRPSGIHQQGTDLAIADIAAKVTILDADDRVVVHLGENTAPEQRGKHGVPSHLWRDGTFTAPHAVRWDRQGNLYVMDWNAEGRISKLRRLA